MTGAEFQTVIAALLLFLGSVWFVRAWARMRGDQREADSPMSGYWGRVFARERVNRARGELCAAVLVVVVGAVALARALG